MVVQQDVWNKTSMVERRAVPTLALPATIALIPDKDGAVEMVKLFVQTDGA